MARALRLVGEDEADDGAEGLFEAGSSVSVGALVPTVLMAVATTWISLYVFPKVGTVSLKFTATGVWFLRLVVRVSMTWALLLDALLLLLLLLLLLAKEMN